MSVRGWTFLMPGTRPEYFCGGCEHFKEKFKGYEKFWEKNKGYEKIHDLQI